MEIVSLQQAVNDICNGEHYWRKIFDVIKPGDVLTVEDFKFQLHQIGLRLSEKQFMQLVKKIDEDGDGAISYDEFTDFFACEQGNLHLQSLTTESELARSVWDKIDVDKNGHLDIDEVGVLMKRLNHGKKVKKKELQRLFNEIDVDGDGTLFSDCNHLCHVCCVSPRFCVTMLPASRGCAGEINYQEFSEWWHVQHEEEVGNTAKFTKQADFMRNVWEDADVDGNGQLCREELRSLFDKMGRKLSEKKFNKAFKKMDADKSGWIDYSEFVGWWHDQSEADFQNFRHFEEYTDDAEETKNALERKGKQLEELTKQMLEEMVPDVPDAGAAVGAAGAAGAAAVLSLGITIPSLDFQTDAIMDTFVAFQEKLSKMQGEVGEKAADIGITADMSLEEKLRAFSQLLQVQVIQLARDKIVPVIDKAVEKAELPGRLIVKKVKALVYELAEKEVRKFTHDLCKSSFDKAMESVSIPGCDSNIEDFEFDVDCDMCGYLV
eukprot:COSAG05_NODE_114_length_18068_cov_60.696422_2_plen_492_part_00